MPLAVDNIEQVKIARLLGVMFSANLDFDEHVTYVLSICSQRLLLIKLFRSQGTSHTLGLALLPQFCSSAVLDPRVGHTMDVPSIFISVLSHSD